MNVLYITIDKSLTLNQKDAPQNSLEREIAIGKEVQNYHIIAMSSQRQGSYQVSHNTVIHAIDSQGIMSFILKSFSMGKRICHEQSIDLISAQDPLLTGLVGLWLKILFHIPLNIQYHGDFLNNPYWLKEHWMNHFFNILGKYIISKADSVLLGVTPNLREKISKSLKIQPDRAHSLAYGLGINTRHFHNHDGKIIRQLYVKNSMDKLALYVGRLCKQKNIALLLRAAEHTLRKFPQTTFLIVGDGPQKNQLVKLTHKLNITEQIHFVGNVPYSKIPDYYAASDIVILPSFYEGCPRVIMEAITAKKPVVTTEKGFSQCDRTSSKFYHVIKKLDALTLAQAINQIFDEDLVGNDKEYPFIELQNEFDQNLAVKGYINSWQKTLQAALNNCL